MDETDDGPEVGEMYIGRVCTLCVMDAVLYPHHFVSAQILCSNSKWVPVVL